MAYVVQELQGSGKPDKRPLNQSALTPVVFRVENVPVGGDPTDDPQLPTVGSQRVVGGEKYYCTRVYVSLTISDTAYEVTAEYSAASVSIFAQPANNRQWDLTYKKYEIKLPIYAKGIRPHGGGATLVWDQVDRTLPVEFQVLNVSVTLLDLGAAGILSAIEAAKAQIGHIHIFPAFSGALWLMNPPSVKSSPEGSRRFTISYSWESDPGNGPIGAPMIQDDEPGAPPRPGNFIVPTMARPPFQEYIVEPSQSFATPPKIGLFERFPARLANGQLNPVYTPNGWASLPGSPI